MKWQREKSSACAMIVIGVALIGVAFDILTKGYLMLHVTERAVQLGRSGSPFLFYTMTIAITAIGAALVIRGVSKLFADSREISPSAQARSKAIGNRRHYLWGIANVIGGILLFGLGFGTSSDANLPRTGPPIIFLAAVFCIMTLCAIGSVLVANASSLEAPSWNRSPFRWFKDPLQSLFVSTWLLLCVVLGTVTRLLSGHEEPLVLLPLYGVILTGLITGQYIVYRIYRKNISHNQ